MTLYDLGMAVLFTVLAVPIVLVVLVPILLWESCLLEALDDLIDWLERHTGRHA